MYESGEKSALSTRAGHDSGRRSDGRPTEGFAVAGCTRAHFWAAADLESRVELLRARLEGRRDLAVFVDRGWAGREEVGVGRDGGRARAVHGVERKAAGGRGVVASRRDIAREYRRERMATEERERMGMRKLGVGWKEAEEGEGEGMRRFTLAC